MKRFTEFKGYRTETVYDKDSGQFVQQRVPLEGIAAEAQAADLEREKKPEKAKPPQSAAQRLASLKRRIEAGRAAVKAPAKASSTSRFVVAVK